MKKSKAPITVEFWVDAVPVAKARARVVTKGGFVHSYTPKKTATFETLVGIRAKEAMRGKPPIAGAVYVRCDFYLPRPQAHYGKGGVKDRFVNAKPVGRPDADNFGKAVCDALNGVAYLDDSQIVTLHISKYFADHREESRVEILIQELSDCPNNA